MLVSPVAATWLLVSSLGAAFLHTVTGNDLFAYLTMLLLLSGILTLASIEG